MDDYEDDVQEDDDFFDIDDKDREQEKAFISGSEIGIQAAYTGRASLVYRLKLPYSNETFLAAYTDNLSCGDQVVVYTRYGRDLAKVLGPIRGKSPDASELAWVDRIASEQDLEKARANGLTEQEAFKVCKEKIEKHRLEMKLILVHCVLEDPRILFFFTADTRIDFRELVKDLVGVFKLRVELRQIGVRDEARILGGLSVCGRGYCCHSIHDKLKPVSIKMAKHQKLSLNSMKISGPCGRLLCCLFYEHGFYSEQQRGLPQEGAGVSFKNEIWKVTEVGASSGQVKLSAPDGRLMTVSLSQLEKKDNNWRVSKKEEKNCCCKAAAAQSAAQSAAQQSNTKKV